MLRPLQNHKSHVTCRLPPGTPCPIEHTPHHASLLTPYVEMDSHSPNFSQPPPDLVRGKNEYEVETIRKHRRFGQNKKLQYLLKWRGYLKSDNMWEPVEQLHALQLLKEYHSRHPLGNIKAILIQQRNHSLFPTSACLRSCHLFTARAAHSPLPVTATSSTTSSCPTPHATSTSVPCVPNSSSIAAALTSTPLTHTSSIPLSSTTFDPSEGLHHPRWLSSMSCSPHSLSTPSFLLITKT